MTDLNFKLGVGLLGLTIVVGGCSNSDTAVVKSSGSPSTASGQSAFVSPSPNLSVQSSNPSFASPSAAVEPSLPSLSSPISSAIKTPTILSKVKQDLSEKIALAKQDTGKTYLSNVLLSQQAEKLVNGRFNPDLKRLPDNIPVETDEYRLEVRQASQSHVVVVAVAKQPGFASYSGVVYAQEGKLPITNICKTNVPSQIPPPPARMAKAGLICEAGSSTVN